MKKSPLEMLYEQFGEKVFTYYLLELFSTINPKELKPFLKGTDYKDLIWCSFMWGNTEKGHQYWSKIAWGIYDNVMVSHKSKKSDHK
jgi:hypothetical protein